MKRYLNRYFCFGFVLFVSDAICSLSAYGSKFSGRTLLRA
jgi:hypothetical protein